MKVNHLSDSEVAELRRLSNEASPEPWEIVEGDDDGSWQGGMSPYRYIGVRKDAEGRWDSDSTLLDRVDAEFIVASRSAFCS